MRPALVTGGSGFIGSYICRALAEVGWRVHGAFGRHEEHVPPASRIRSVHVDLARSGSIARVLDSIRPHLIVHTAAMSALKDCEQRPEMARLVNTKATADLADWCRQNDAHLIFFSTDQVFDGSEGSYSESDPPSPIHVYGRTKAEAEERVLESGATASVLRLSLVYGPSPGGQRSHHEQVLLAVRQNERLRFFSDEYRNPILAADVAAVVVELAAMEGLGLLHLAGPDRMSRVDFGRAILRAFGHEHVDFDTVTLAEANMMPRRPPDLSLDTSRARGLLTRTPRGVRDGLGLLAAEESRLA
ncbi:MAG: SDR family oxidoreductase [Phycisphaerales bacterium]|nr:MAG: SDR family oxidoreductase [Phycisphaerales bacterium]